MKNVRSEKTEKQRAGLLLKIVIGVVIAFVLIGVLYAIKNSDAQRDNYLQSNQGDHHTAHQIANRVEVESGAWAGVNKTQAPTPSPEGMVWIPGGTFWMGCEDCNMPDAEPIHLVTVDGFWMDTVPVTNSQF